MKALKHINIASLFLVFTSVLPLNAKAGLINFESIPGGIPTDGLAVNTQFLATDGVTFALENGTDPVLAQVGAPATGFGPNDTIVSGPSIGSFFLTDDGQLSGLTSSPLIVSYTTPTAAASGVVIDIDFDETFTIEARDISNNILQTVIISAGDLGTGDATATPWSIQHSSGDIYSLRFVGTRTAGGAFGLGFDNFNTSSAVVPIPAAVWLFGSGLLGLIGISRRKKAA